MFKRRLKLLGKILLGFILLVVAFLLIERWRGQIALASYKKELRAKGEKLSPQEIMALRPQGTNAMPEVFAAYERLKVGVVMPDRYPPAMRLVVSGRAIGGSRLDHWVEDGITNRWEQLAGELQVNAATLADIRTALSQPVLHCDLDLSQGARMKLPLFAKVTALTRWFRAESLLAFHDNEPGIAVESLAAHIRLPQSLVEDRVAISEMIRFAMSATAAATTWETTQADGWLDSDLAQIHSAWVEQGFMSNLAASLEGERAYSLATYNMVRSSNDEAFQLIFVMEQYLSLFGDDEGDPWWKRKLEQVPGYEASVEFLQRNIFCRIWRFVWLDQDELRYLERMQVLIEAARTAASQNSLVAVESKIAALEDSQNNFGLYDHLRFPMQRTIFPLTKLLQRATRAESDRSLAISAIALKRYSLRYGKHPSRMDELVPEFLSVVPVDYMDGKPIKYRLNADGGFTLYSVGKDGKDDSGDLSLPSDVKNFHDLWRRRDYVWPAPATSEEVEQYRREAGKD